MPDTLQRSIAVFLAHSPVDATPAGPVRDRLREAGFDVVPGVELRAPGENTLEELGRAIRDSQAVVVLLTPAFLRSSWLPVELGMARALGTPMFLLLDGVRRDEVPSYLWANLAVPVSRLADVLDALAHLGEPISDDQRLALADAYAKTGISVDTLLTDATAGDRLIGEFRAATGSRASSANVLRELLSLRKRGQLPRLRTSA